MNKKKAKPILVQRNGLRCEGCDWMAPDERYLEIDHKSPKSEGGKNELENFALLCGPCNKKKGHFHTIAGLRRENQKDGLMFGPDRDSIERIYRQVIGFKKELERIRGEGSQKPVSMETIQEETSAKSPRRKASDFRLKNGDILYYALNPDLQVKVAGEYRCELPEGGTETFFKSQQILEMRVKGKSTFAQWIDRFMVKDDDGRLVSVRESRNPPENRGAKDMKRRGDRSIS